MFGITFGCLTPIKGQAHNPGHMLWTTGFLIPQSFQDFNMYTSLQYMYLYKSAVTLIRRAYTDRFAVIFKLLWHSNNLPLSLTMVGLSAHYMMNCARVASITLVAV